VHVAPETLAVKGGVVCTLCATTVVASSVFEPEVEVQ
jgi:hypothetical protein